MTLVTSTVTVTDAHRRYAVEAILDDLRPSGDALPIGVLLRPAFNGETLLSFDPSVQTITVSAYDRSLWYLLAEHESREPTTKERLLEKYRGVTPPPPTIQIWRETAIVSASTGFRNTLSASFQEAIAESGSLGGADGISVLGFSFERGAEVRFADWSPRPGSKSHRFVHLLYEVARQNLASTEVERRLEELHGYLALGLPWRVMSSSPLVVRIFGSLSTTELPELRAALEQLPLTEPIVLDLSRLAGMGTLLYPMWRQWLEGRRNVRWVVGDGAAFHLESIGVPAGVQHRDLSSALDGLR
ncbi:MAG: hypothetical protein HOV80_03965 [Polyangiaceae bacterium]|nr:hypothetical protein [Polyangiaceae bacterium]